MTKFLTFDISDITNFSCVCSLFVLLSTEEESGKYFAVGELAGKDLQGGDDGNWKITQSAKYSNNPKYSKLQMLPSMQNPRLVRVFIMGIGHTRLSAKTVPILSRG